MIRLYRILPLVLVGTCVLPVAALSGCDGESAREKKALAAAVQKANAEADAQDKAAQRIREKGRKLERLIQPIKRTYDEACYAVQAASRKKLADLEDQFDADRRKTEANSQAEQRAIQNQIQDAGRARADAEMVLQQKMYQLGSNYAERSMVQNEITTVRRKYEAEVALKQEEGAALLAALHQRVRAIAEAKIEAVHAVEADAQKKLDDLKLDYNDKLQMLEEGLAAK